MSASRSAAVDLLQGENPACDLPYRWAVFDVLSRLSRDRIEPETKAAFFCGYAAVMPPTWSICHKQGAGYHFHVWGPE